MKPFLTAEWRNLLNLTYAVDPALLQSYLPPGLQCALYRGQAHVSFIAFDFLETRLKGIKVPFHVNFPEVNLRFYVQRGKAIGVVFVRELVPRYWIAQVARTLYNEPYRAVPMRTNHLIDSDSVHINHQFRVRGHWFNVSAASENQPYLPASDSVEHYLKEHEIGFGQTHGGRTLYYHVEHPAWRVYPNVSPQLDVDFGWVYGPQWAFLNERQPDYTLLAEGSPVTVFMPVLLEKSGL